jgi:hypothetical protein
MLRRSARVFILLLTTALSAGVVWRVTINEQERGRARMASAHVDATAADALFLLADLRASLHAYVAPGQGDAFWSARAAGLLDAVRTRLLEIDAASSAAGYPLARALDGMDRLEAAELRAREYARQAQPLAAGDIIFTEARDLIDAVSRELSGARQMMARASAAREAGTANEQSLLAGALMSVWIVSLILLVPVPRAADAAAAAPATTQSITEVPQTPPAPTEALVEQSVPPPEPAVAPSATPVFRALADLCGDVGRVSDASELDPILARAADLLGATGLVVWLLSDDEQTLAPAVAHGYQPHQLARMGTVPLTADNLTVSAFRTAAPATRAGAGDRPAAVAVPMVSSTGPSGVLAAEVRQGEDLEQAAALAAVVAAQLANLFPAPERLAERTAT